LIPGQWERAIGAGIDGSVLDAAARRGAGVKIAGGTARDTLREAERSRLRRDRFGFVFQFGQLVPELTAEENVALPLLLGGTQCWSSRLRLPSAWACCSLPSPE
jgi:ABC-type lipoprotein export system ATPase subunit